MPGPALPDPLRRQDRQRSPPGWKPSQRLAAPPPADAPLRHSGNKSPLYRSKVVVPAPVDTALKSSHVSTDRRTTGIGRDARPVNRSPPGGDRNRDADTGIGRDTRPVNRSPPGGDRNRDAAARRPRSDNVPVATDRQPLQPRATRPAAGDSTDHLRNNTSSAARDAYRQGTTRGV